LRQSALLADLQRCCFSPNRQLADFFIGFSALFFKKTADLCLEKAGRSGYLISNRTNLVLILIIIRKNVGFMKSSPLFAMSGLRGSIG
jgi:hypothetical protein